MLPPRDNEGFLLDLGDWNEAVAGELAREAGVALGDEHWQMIGLIRAFYASFEVSPPMRVLVRHAREAFGPERGSSLYLLRLFPGSPARLLAKIAGLPRPSNCL